MNTPNCKNCYHYGVCHYVDSTLPVCGVYVEREKVVVALQAEKELEKELKSATFLIETLEIILSGYSRAATNMCAYESYKKIKDWQSRHIKEDF